MDKDAMIEGRYRTIKMRNPEWSEDQIQERMKEIADYYEKRSKEWQNPKLKQIWGK